jgi:ketosteroid isomerase-like protein
MSEENFELIRRVVAAVNERDLDGYLSCCTEDVRLVPAWTAVAGDYEGPDGIRRFFSDLGDTMPDFQVEIERLEPVRTTRVLALLRVHATGRASGVTDSGLAVGQPEATSGAPTANIYDFADGKIDRVRVILDREEARELAARP